LLPDASVCHHPVGAACLRHGCLSLPHWLREQARYHRIGEVIRRAALVVSTSDSLRGSLAEQGIASHRVYLFSDPPDAPLPRNPDTVPLFLYVGRLDIEKGVDILLQAYALARARIPASRLRIVGQGAEQPSLERLATGLGLGDSVRFCGWRKPREIAVELNHAWALVAPSRWPEPFGLVALEAMFRGVPAIVPSLGGFAETVEHGVNGLKFAPGDALSLSEQLLDIASDSTFPQHTLAPDEVARTRQRFSRALHVERLRTLLRKVTLPSGPEMIDSGHISTLL
jgi:glycosyltransferase involved in cell wall biosynthesis